MGSGPIHEGEFGRETVGLDHCILNFHAINLHSAALAAAQIFYEFTRVACGREWARDPFTRVNSGVKQWASIIAD